MECSLENLTQCRNDSFNSSEEFNISLQVGDKTLSGVLIELNYVIYYIMMMMILFIGVPGNVVMLLILRLRDFRTNVLTPLLLNMAVADLFIILCGYPVSVFTIVNYGKISRNTGPCYWSGTVNCTVGIAAIMTHASISVMMLYKVKSLTVRGKLLGNRNMTMLIVGIWAYALIVSTPPFFGWSQIVPHSSNFSCGPAWSSSDNFSFSYSVFLVITGFVIPVGVMSSSYAKTYLFLRKSYLTPNHCRKIRNYRLNNLRRIVNMLLLAMIAFIISWTPYCIISILSMKERRDVSTPTINLLLELAAKASVIYNPLVFIFANKEFRSYLSRKDTYRRLCCFDERTERYSFDSERAGRRKSSVASILFSRDFWNRRNSELRGTIPSLAKSADRETRV